MDCNRFDSLFHSIDEPNLSLHFSTIFKSQDCSRLPKILLEEGSPLFNDLGSKTIHRIRAWSYYQLAKDTALHKTLDPFAIADLSNSNNPYVLSAIAKAIKEHQLLSNQSNLKELLERALSHVRYRDRPITFDAYFPTDHQDYVYTNAKELLGAALASLSPKPGSCCSIPLLSKQTNIHIDHKKIVGLPLTDQAGNTLSFSTFFDRPTILVFFYTRCQNPYKCSATITRLGQLAKQLGEQNVRIAGITYDPWYDKADRLRKYGEDRGFQFSEDSRLFTYDERQFSVIQDHFGLKVNYESSLVTVHAAELFILDADGSVLYTNNRQEWDVESVLKILLK